MPRLIVAVTLFIGVLLPLGRFGRVHAQTAPPSPGPTTLCISRPAFLARLKVSEPVYIDIDANGPVLRYRASCAQDIRTYQPRNWQIAGTVADYTLDRDGDIYLFSAPYVSLERNPLWKQNNLYRIGSQTGLMSLFLHLPWAQAPTTANPFGIMGMAYDCDTHSLYVSSIAGSTPQQELGRIFQIDLAHRTIVDVMEDVDAFGLMVYRGPDGKRLYYGSARDSGVRSVPLTDTGAIVPEPRLEFYLAQAPGGRDHRAFRIFFPQPGVMKVQGGEFFYSLGVSYKSTGLDYIYRYDSDSNTWQFESITPRTP